MSLQYLLARIKQCPEKGAGAEEKTKPTLKADGQKGSRVALASVPRPAAAPAS
ncbi:MAG TPA: hypothetical protein VFI31_04525 [Pirellulales bacterium]|nr:hypothetical protein [Pirellulales bacterium]